MEQELTQTEEEMQSALAKRPNDAAPVTVGTGAPPPDAKALRTTHIGKLLGQAYEGASTLKLNKQEQKDLRADFPDEAVEIRPHDGIIYISHMALRERLWDVFGPTNVAEICRERFIRSDTNEVAVDLVLMIRGVFIAEGVGTAKYYPNNPKASFGDTVESAWSDAIRRCCKKFGVGTQVWRPQYVREWLAKYAGQRQDGKYYRRNAAATPEAASKKKPAREYTLKGKAGDEHGIEEVEQSGGGTTFRKTSAPEEDDDALPF
jgi:hypothetical protein